MLCDKYANISFYFNYIRCIMSKIAPVNKLHTTDIFLTSLLIIIMLTIKNEKIVVLLALGFYYFLVYEIIVIPVA